ncbi:MAG: OmpH family outer membrane protein [Balneola sp.]|nr:OmpH family outer membrane protein [Balneola sp.]MBO6651385.1 OmpH family outer membrane protein [Balneola sp.]MBO6710988.1 OmpH family outer membrane protein [Balneola sp.]MBO6801504.1 OmpH family outer membrane protein [Balneola sp.]MBO6870408.1 OmpH family outer membrane protein [Balneola sp.]
MKVVLRNITLLSLIILFSGHIYGQDQKIGYYESDFVLSKIPEYTGIEQRLKILSDGWKNEIQQLRLEIENLEEDYSAKEILYTEEIKKEKIQEINTKKRQLDNFTAQKFGPDGEYFQKQKELLEPIQRQVFAAVRNVAQRNGMDFVFDRSGDVYMVYARGEWNLNEQVLLELGIEIEQ